MWRRAFQSGSRAQPDGGSLREAVERAARNAGLVVVRENLFKDLLAALGDVRALMDWLAELTARIGHPIAVRLQGNTTFLSPPRWSNQRLRGWVAGHAESL